MSGGRHIPHCLLPESIDKPEARGHLSALAAAGVVGMPLHPVYSKSRYQALGISEASLGTPPWSWQAGGARTERQGPSLVLRRQQVLQAECDVML